MGTAESGNRTAYRVTTITMIVVTVLNGVGWMGGALPTGVGFAAFVGTVLAIPMALLYFRGRSSGKRAASIVLFGVNAFAGWIAVAFGVSQLPSYVGILHTAWVFLFVAGMIVRTALNSSLGSARAADTDRAIREAEAARIAANRQRETDYALAIERQQSGIAHASRPGRMTGYEPDALGGIVLVPSAHMFGEPGEGLRGAGFDDAAVERGIEGERNFAKALVKAGLLDRFATFWSVHMPDENVGASDQFQTDIDCVIVTGTSVWLIDVKNYNQGDVTWSTEVRNDEAGVPQNYLIAVDAVTGGYVGDPRRMSRNMQLATMRFRKRFTDSGIGHRVNPAVVLMPRRDGLGLVRDVTWPEQIPAAGLPDALRWLAAEPPYDPADTDSAFLTRILKVLVKDASGSAPKLGQQRTNVAAPPAAVPAPSGGDACAECGAALAADQTFCFACGAPR